MRKVALFLLFFVTLYNSSYSRTWEQWDKDNIANTIDHYWRTSALEKEWRQDLKNLTTHFLQPSDHLLEVGCGSGLIYNELVPSCFGNENYTGIDTSTKMLSIAKQRYPMGNFLFGDAYNLTYANESFDMVIAYEVLGHIPHIEKVISEMFRVTRRIAIFTVWESEPTRFSQEVINGTTFVHASYSAQDVLNIIQQAVKNNYTVTRIPMKGHAAYIILKH